MGFVLHFVFTFSVVVIVIVHVFFFGFNVNTEYRIISSESTIFQRKYSSFLFDSHRNPFIRLFVDVLQLIQISNPYRYHYWCQFLLKAIGIDFQSQCIQDLIILLIIILSRIICSQSCTHTRSHSLSHQSIIQTYSRIKHIMWIFFLHNDCMPSNWKVFVLSDVYWLLSKAFPIHLLLLILIPQIYP